MGQDYPLSRPQTLSGTDEKIMSMREVRGVKERGTREGPVYLLYY